MGLRRNDTTWRPSRPNYFTVKGVKVPPPEAYISNRYWVIRFESLFPGKAEKMRNYSKEQGWTDDNHYINWFEPCYEWVKKNADKRKNNRKTKT